MNTPSPLAALDSLVDTITDRVVERLLPTLVYECRKAFVQGLREVDGERLLVDKTRAAAMFCAGEKTIRRLVNDGRLRRIVISPGCVRYDVGRLRELARELGQEAVESA